MKRFVYLLIIGLIFVLLYNLFPSKEGYNGDGNNENQGPPSETAAQAAAAAQAATAQATADQSMAKAMQGIADDTLEGRGDYTHPLVVDIFAAAARCPGPVVCGGVTCGVPNCKCVGIPPNDTCGPVEGCPPCCPPCQSGTPCPEPVPCGDTYCTQPNCLCYGDPPTCHPGGCAGCGPIAPSPASQYITGLVDKEKAYEEQCLSNRAQIAANAATLTSFPAKLKSAYAKLKPMELKINKSTQYIQASAGILEKFIRNQMAAAAAAASKANGISIDGVSFGIIPKGAIPKLIWFVEEGMPEAEVLLKKLAAGAKAAGAAAK